MDSDLQALDQFMYRQCRIRQASVRTLDGRPSSGMRPEVLHPETGEKLATITTLVLKRDTEEYTAQFRFIVSKTQDPTDRIKNGLRLLSEAYYQQHKGFVPRLTALFSLDSELATALVHLGSCGLRVEQDSKRFNIKCSIEDLPHDDPLHQGTHWHNHMFNPSLPGRTRVLAFTPESFD